MTEKEYRSAIEAILFAAGDPVDVKRLCETFELPEIDEEDIKGIQTVGDLVAYITAHLS
jgi:chromosome segregation and condensation protein ScpB